MRKAKQNVMTFSLQWRGIKAKPVHLSLGRVREKKRSRWQCSLSYLPYFFFLYLVKVKTFRQSKERGYGKFLSYNICLRTNSMEHCTYHYSEHSISAIRYKEYLPVQEHWVHVTLIVSDLVKIKFSAGWNWFCLTTKWLLGKSNTNRYSKAKRAFASYIFSHACWLM